MGMKKVPFSLELAKQGVAFRCYDEDVDNHYIDDFYGRVFLWYSDETGSINVTSHLINKAPKKN